MQILERAMEKLRAEAEHDEEAAALLDHVMELRSDALELTDQLVKARETMRQIATHAEAILKKKKQKEHQEQEAQQAELLPKGE